VIVRRLSAALTRLRGTLTRADHETDLSAELDANFQAHVDDNIRGGMSEADARRHALVALGGVAQIQEAVRDRRSLPFVEKTMQDIRYALRSLKKTPGFSIAAIATLALGIGANTAIFSLVSAVLLRPLPFPEADRLMLVWDDMRARGGPPNSEASPADYAAWKQRSHSFTGMAAIAVTTYNLTGSGEPQKLSGIRTTANLFSVLGMQAVLGRTLLDADDLPASNAAVALSERLWRSTFAADPNVVGRTITLNGLPHTVVGVVPPDFQFPDKDAAVWVAAKFTSAELSANGTYFMYVVARLKRGVDQAAAQSEMTTIARQLAHDAPRTNGRVGIYMTALHDHLTRSVRPAMVMLLGAVALVLAIACVNVANLLLSRGAGRRREIALRKSLGAADTRVIRQLLTESAVIAALGAAVGLALAPPTFTYLTRLVPSGFPTGTHPSLDPRVLLFTAVIASVVVLAFGVGPALITAGVSPGAVLKSSGRGGTASVGAARVRQALAVAEVTLTMLLLVAAGLLLRSYANVLGTAPGFDPNHLLVAQTVLPPSKYNTLASRSAFYDRVLERVRALPSVSGAGYANFVPLTMKGGRAYFSVEGEAPPPPTDSSRNVTIDRVITPGYLQTLGATLIRGRHFDGRDRKDSPLSAVVNERFAKMHWADRDPIGRRIRFGAGSAAPWMTVVGVVNDVRQTGLDTPLEPEVYIPAAQADVEFAFFWPQFLVVRTSTDPLVLSSAVRDAVSNVDPDEPVANIRSMSQLFDAELLNRNTQMVLVGVFAALALLMASIGLYGVLSYNVAQRVPELGVRIALGAQPSAVVRMVVGHGGVMALAGIAVGLLVSIAGGRLLSSLLYQVSPYDPGVLLAATSVLLVVALVACWLPARRAASIDPLAALRTE
jgi:putative ABC transport system permease protein